MALGGLFVAAALQPLAQTPLPAPALELSTTGGCASVTCTHGAAEWNATVQRCSCRCQVGYTGLSCNTCAVGWTGYPLCSNTGDAGTGSCSARDGVNSYGHVTRVFPSAAASDCCTQCGADATCVGWTWWRAGTPECRLKASVDGVYRDDTAVSGGRPATSSPAARGADDDDSLPPLWAMAVLIGAGLLCLACTAAVLLLCCRKNERAEQPAEEQLQERGTGQARFPPQPSQPPPAPCQPCSWQYQQQPHPSFDYSRPVHEDWAPDMSAMYDLAHEEEVCKEVPPADVEWAPDETICEEVTPRSADDVSVRMSPSRGADPPPFARHL